MHKLHNSFQKGLILLKHMCSQTFYPNLQTFLHGLIRHIRDILQLCYKALEVISTSDATKNKQRQQLMQQV